MFTLSEAIVQAENDAVRECQQLGEIRVAVGVFHIGRSFRVERLPPETFKRRSQEADYVVYAFKVQYQESPIVQVQNQRTREFEERRSIAC